MVFIPKCKRRIRTGMSKKPDVDNSKEKFLNAAVDEINKYGIVGFSMRRAAKACKLSSGAPYKHFKSKNEVISEIFKMINNRWHERQLEILSGCDGDLMDKLLEISIGYVKFLYENPKFQSILMMNDSSFDTIQFTEKMKMSDISADLVKQYCISVSMPEDVARRKTYVVRSLIYGAALLLSSGDFKYGEDSINTIRKCMQREFELA